METGGHGGTFQLLGGAHMAPSYILYFKDGHVYSSRDPWQTALAKAFFQAEEDSVACFLVFLVWSVAIPSLQWRKRCCILSYLCHGSQAQVNEWGRVSELAEGETQILLSKGVVWEKSMERWSQQILSRKLTNINKNFTMHFYSPTTSQLLATALHMWQVQ